MYSPVRPSILVLSLLFVLLVTLAAARPCFALPQSPQSGPPASSLDSLKSRAQAGDPVAQLKLAVEYLRSNPGAPDYTSVIKWLRASGAQGNTQAQFMLGYLYQNGEGTERDYAKAAESYQAAASQGYPPAANKSRFSLRERARRCSESRQGLATLSIRRGCARFCRSVQSRFCVLPRLRHPPRLRARRPMVSSRRRAG